MTITPHPITAANFNEALYQFLKPLEGDIPFVYSDSKGIPTLGIGYALVEKDSLGVWVLRDYPAELLAAGINLTPTQLVDLDANLTMAMKALNGDTSVTNPFSPYYPVTARNNPLGWTIDTTQSRSLFDLVVPIYETRVKSWLGNDTLYTSLQGSMEMVALFSMSFNGLINVDTSPLLRDAILAGDRAEAWYQIRYVHANELWSRRYSEATMFGLTENAAMAEAEARTVYRMFFKYHDAIIAADTAHGGIGSLTTSLQPAATFLVNQYGQGKNFSALNIFVAETNDSPTLAALGIDGGYVDRTADTQDVLIIGGANADLFYGGSGNDVLYGGEGIDLLYGKGGNDVLVGGTGADTMIGGTGNDTYEVDNLGDVVTETSTLATEIDTIYSSITYDLALTPNVENLTLTGTTALDGTGNDRANKINGNSADNILRGGLGNDILLGGAGDDTYVFTTGDGFDIIHDSDGLGSITVDGAGFAAGIQYGDDRVYRNASGQFYVKDGNDLILDSKIMVLNYDPFLGNGLGLTLISPAAEANPVTTRDIYGDLAPIDQDPATAGVQLGYDSLNNVITDPNTPSPNRSDTLYDSAGKDHIMSGGGFDIIRASRGGDDLIDAGAGLDFVIESTAAGGGNDVIMGGAGRDILSGGTGNDRIYADTQISVDQAIFLGNTPNTGIAQYGDWLSGGTDDDTLIGSAGIDVLMGGGGTDLLIGGAGDDYIAGDVNWAASDFAWYTVNNNMNHTWTIYFNPEPGYDGYALPTTGAADVIYGGEGNDRVTGGFGNDVIFGEGGGDILYGDQDNDILMGGAGMDVIFGGTGDDIIIGGTGDDILDGGAGQDIYIYNKGDGKDHIRENAASSNTLRFGTGISSSDITLNLGSLKLNLGNGDEIHIAGFNRNDVFNSSSISSFEFDDGTTLTTAYLLVRGFEFKFNGRVRAAANDASYGNSLGRKTA